MRAGWAPKVELLRERQLETADKVSFLSLITSAGFANVCCQEYHEQLLPVYSRLVVFMDLIHAVLDPLRPGDP